MLMKVVRKVSLKRELWKSLKIPCILIAIKVIGVLIILNGDRKNQFVHSDIVFDTICKVIGVSITLNGDLKNQFVESDVGFDTISKILISGKMAVDINRERKYINLPNMAVSKIQEGALDKLLDPALQFVMKNDEGARDVVSCLAELAFRCLPSQQDDRPDMKEFIEVLQELCGKTDEQKDRKRSDVALPSPISIHDKWPSTTTTPSNNSADL